MKSQPHSEPKTLEITNFGGRLSRILNGDLNSGFAKFIPSFGYDPFSKPMNLTWLETASSVAGVSDMMMVGKTRFETNTQYVYGVGSTGKAYKIQPNSITNPNLDSVIGIGSITAGGETYNFGASMEFYGTPENLFVGGDKQINKVPISSVVTGMFGGDTVVGNANNYATNVPRPLKPFAGDLVFGNGPTIAVIDSTNTVTSSIVGLGIGTTGGTKNIYTAILPALPPENTVQDLDVSIDYNYALISASNIPGEDIITVGSDRQVSAATDSNVYRWNGVDVGVTAATSVPSFSLTALQTYLQSNLLFSDNAFGMAVSDGSTTQLSLPNNKSPLANATGVNGSFGYWICPEVVNGTSLVASLYYFGQLDQENPSGLYRLLRYTTTLANGFIYQTPFCILVNNKYLTVNNAITALVTLGYGKHYFSTTEVNNSTTNLKFYRFLVTPSGTGTSQLGVYETQNQLFSKRIGIAQIRVYTEPTVANNGFQVDIIGGDGNVVDNGTFNYSFGSVVDPNTSSNSTERINFNPNCKTLFSFGLRITNTGTSNMTIKKIEVDYDEQGK